MRTPSFNENTICELQDRICELTQMNKDTEHKADTLLIDMGRELQMMKVQIDRIENELRQMKKNVVQ